MCPQEPWRCPGPISHEKGSSIYESTEWWVEYSCRAASQFAMTRGGAALLTLIRLFSLEPAAGGHTRILIRYRGFVRPTWLDIAYRAAIVPTDHIVATGMLNGLAAGHRWKLIASRTHRRAPAATRPGALYQVGVTVPWGASPFV